MAVRVFNKRATFRLEAEDGRSFVLRPMAFVDVPEEFTGDITFRKGVESGVIEVFDTPKQGDKIEKEAHDPVKKTEVTRKKVADAK